MADQKKQVTLTWEGFQSLGNPDNVLEEKIEETIADDTKRYMSKIRVYIEKKGRKGKTVTLVKGLELDSAQLGDLCKKLKTACGVGGGLEGEYIMVQGDQRKKVIQFLLKWGYRDVKNAGM